MKIHLDEFDKNPEYYLSLVRNSGEIIEIYSDSGFSMKISLEKDKVSYGEFDVN